MSDIDYYRAAPDMPVSGNIIKNRIGEKINYDSIVGVVTGYAGTYPTQSSNKKRKLKNGQIVIQKRVNNEHIWWVKTAEGFQTFTSNRLNKMMRSPEQPNCVK